MNGPIAITGASGFAGQHLIAMLDAAQIPMRVLVREGPRTCGFGSAETVIGSLEDEAALTRLVTSASAIIHLAGAITAPNRKAFFAVNTDGTERLAKAAIAAGIERFIHVSSLSAREPHLSDYGASKREAEERLARLGPPGLVILRPPVIYGPRDRATLPLLAQLTRRVAFIPGSPDARFSLLHVDDFAQMLAARLDDASEGVHEIDDGTPHGYGWADLISVASRSERHPVTPVYLPRWLLSALALPLSAAGALLGGRLPLTPGKVRELYHPDWVARSSGTNPIKCIRFAEGFPRTVEWYRKEGWLPAAAHADKTQAQSDQGEATR